MYIHKRVPVIFTYCLLIAGLFSSCYKKDIQVGSDLAESHTRIITVDTVGVVLSSYVLDSFTTNNNSFSLIGIYNDSYVGKTTASTFLQVGLPTLGEDASTLLPKSAVYDSLILDMRPSGYYYGDTLQPFAISVYELAQQPSIEDKLDIYNTSNLPVISTPLATWSRNIRPSAKDSVIIRLPNTKGQDFFNKIQSKATQFSSQEIFLDYFKGIAIKPTNTNNAAVYGFNLGDSSVRLRLHYHLSLPFKQDKIIEFVITRKEAQFNRIITNRNGTPLQPATNQQREFFASNTNPFAFSQTGTGVYLKALFPTLREMLKINEVVRLMNAKLVLKVVKGTYDLYGNRLPNPLYLQTTDASNIPGGILTDTTGQGVTQVRSPSIDFVYGSSTTYTFDISSYINALLNTPGTADHGLFILESAPNVAKQINRAVIGGTQNETYQTKLVLNLLTIE
ncbi:MAG TPA: DUF4270 family protein [Niastella sp.]